MSYFCGKSSRASGSRARSSRPWKGYRSGWPRMPTHSAREEGHTMQCAPQYAREYFSEEVCVESSTYRELLV